MHASESLGQAAPQPRVDGAHEADEPSAGDRADLWSAVLQILRNDLRREQFETWFPRTHLAHIDDEQVVIAVHNGFTRDWLNNYYRDALGEALGQVLGSPRNIEFEVDPDCPADSSLGEPLPPEETALPATASPAAPDVAQPGVGRLLEASDVQLNPHYRFDNFVVGPCNRFAHAACVGVSEKSGRLYNPLFIHGSVGLGKTHLLQSLCHAILERDVATRILFLSCETFVNHFIEALENGDLQRFRHKYRNVDVLVVDDIHILANKERTQEEFFHTFNTLYNAGKQIVLSSDSPPVDIPTLQNRLVSRFKWGLVTEIEQPCFETRMAILKRKSRARGHELPEEAACLLAERIDSNIRELEGAVTKVLGYAALSGQPVSPALVRECLPEIFTLRTNQPTMQDVLQLVTERFDVRVADLQSKKRTNAIAFPRQIAMYLARRITRLSLEGIGGYFGGRDHSTVLYGVEKITRLAKEDPGLARTLSDLMFELRGRRSESL